jgi:polar amino acid transport system substrate-binding protein
MPRPTPRFTVPSHRLLSRRGAMALTTGLAVALLAACGGTTSGDSASGAKDYGLIVPGVITAGTHTEQAAYAFIGADGKPTGFAIELLAEAAKRLGLKVDYKLSNTQGILAGLTAGKYDIGFTAFVATDERKKSVDFLKPFNWAHQVFLTPQASTATGLGDFSGKRVGVVTGSISDTWATTNLRDADVIQFKDQTAAMAQLRSGGIDAFLTSGTDGPALIAKDNGKFKVAVETEFPAGSSAPVRKGLTALITAFDTTIDEMIADGTYKQLYDKFINHPFSPKLVTERPGLAKYVTPTASPSAGSSASGASPSKTP